MSCNVLLLSSTPFPDGVVAAAARLCYSDVPAEALFEREPEEKTCTLLSGLRESGHFSPFEHASFTFAVDGLSRVASHQLVRHRIASFSQQSQRYVTMSEVEMVVPPAIAGSAAMTDVFLKASECAHDAYRRLVEMGAPKEDARYILPHGWCTKLVMTMNARELHHFFALRLCRRAQWEIRDLARKMLALVREAAPLLFETAGPSCVVRGRCEEMKPCGMPYASIDELLNEKSG